jgi:peptidoglycan/LPS O-acetylase OafA/YrhL
MLLAIAYREGVRVPMLACIGLIVASFMLSFVLYRYVSADPALRAINWGLPAVLLVAGATLGGFSLASPWWRALAIIGNASYSLYLFHSFSIRAVISLAHRAGQIVAAADELSQCLTEKETE